MTPVLPLRPRRGIGAAVAALVVLSGCGGQDVSTTAAGDGSSTVAVPAPTTTAAARSAPRWETVVTLSGTGPIQPAPVAILPGAIQWRVRWSCETGSLRITTTPPPRRGGPMVSGACPGKGEGFSISTGSIQLGVEASGPWTAVVDQQIDTPLDEPVPAELASATLVAQGSFYDVEKTGAGIARLHRLADGRRILRFEGFSVTQNTDLFVWLSQAPEPRTSADATAAPKVVLGNLKSTLGNQNYEIPPEVPTERIRSVVIWCQPVAIAYSAAALGG